MPKSCVPYVHVYNRPRYAGTYVHIVLGFLSENFNQAADSQESPHTTALCVKTIVVMLQIVFLLVGAEEIAEGSGGHGLFRIVITPDGV